jgi:GTP-binding protein
LFDEGRDLPEPLPFLRRKRMIIKNVNLETVCGITSTIPLNTQPEFAFAGKSNVGKSSLINGLMNRKAYARISAEPGKTQTINFYHINDAYYLVDLPGYGYASRAKEDIQKWGTMIENYLHRSDMLKLVFLLIDIRHEPSDNDHMMYEWILHQGFEPVIIATKADKIKKAQMQKQLNMLRASLKLPQEAMLIPYSAMIKQGREEIYSIIEKNL